MPELTTPRTRVPTVAPTPDLRNGGRRQERVLLVARLSIDIAMLGLAAVSAAFGSHSAGVAIAPGFWLAVYPILVLGLFKLRAMYRLRVAVQPLDDLRQIVSVTAVAAMVLLAARALLADDPFLAAQSIRQWLFSAVYLSAGSIAFGSVVRQRRRHGRSMRPTLIVGAGQVGQLAAKRLLERPEYGLQPIGFLDKEPLDETPKITGLPVLGASWDLERAIAANGVRHVVVTFSTAPDRVLIQLVNRCRELEVPVSLVPRLFETATERLMVDHLGGLPLIAFERPDPKGWQFLAKYTLDRLLGALCLVVALPVLGAAACAVRVSMGRPVLYRQSRVGLDGKTFEILKFRSMTVPRTADDWNGARESGPDEEHRLTPVGAFLRHTSLDELPQLWNVMRGDMSLVGPRPERPEFTQSFERRIHRYDERHRVKSGITGWAQVHGIGRGRDRFSEGVLGDRVEWDNYYIENWSLWLDVKILLMTVAAVLHFRQP
jgi:exopolysaccharide biosynthesis polyprenyl glycosylphosphotransferase